MTVETSPGNFHYWYLFDRPVSAKQAKLIGDALRARDRRGRRHGRRHPAYRVAGTPNFPSKAKQARGRTPSSPRALWSGRARLWDPDELLAPVPPAPLHRERERDAARLQARACRGRRRGGPARRAYEGDPRRRREQGLGAKGDKSRSALFHHVVGELKKRRWAVEAIVALFERYPHGVGAKYAGRILEEVRRSYAKVENGGLSFPEGGGRRGRRGRRGGARPGSAGGASGGDGSGSERRRGRSCDRGARGRAADHFAAGRADAARRGRDRAGDAGGRD